MPKLDKIYEGRPPTRHEIEKVSKRRKFGLYEEIVSKFFDSKRPMWSYPVLEGVNGSTYLNSFRHAIITLGLKYRISAHGCKSKTEDVIVLMRER
jgi:hypothetical protein